MHTKAIKIDSGPGKAAVVGICAIGVALALLFAKWAFGHAVAVNALEPEVSAFGVDLAPGDPNAHYAFGQLLERTLLADDQRKAISEFESAASLSPHNYLFWLALARAHEQSGDADAAERSLRKAQELAPNYSRVQWALGNLLLRRGRQPEGFDQIRKAVSADQTFAGPAAAAAWQIFDGDVAQIHSAVGESPRINASIAVLLVAEKRYAEAMDFWRRASRAGGSADTSELGRTLYSKLIDSGAYRSAIEVAHDTGSFQNTEAVIGSISNGSFESPLLMSRDASGFFSWNIADGAYPRIGQTRDQKRSGDYSLLISFGQGGSGSRPVTQKVGVEPAAGYELRLFYRSEMAGATRLRCDVVSAQGSPIAGTVLPPTRDWTSINLPFTVPENVEGIEVRISTGGCEGSGCSSSGSVWFDDISLTKSR